MNKISTRFILLTLAFIAGCISKTYSQSTNFEPGSPVYPLLERMEIKSGNLNNQLFLDIQPVQRSQVNKDLFIYKDAANLNLSSVDKYWIDYLTDENLPYTDGNWNSSKMPVFNIFYQSKANFLQYTTHDSDFQVFVNPVLDFGFGKEKDSSTLRYQDTRGLELRGSLDKKLGFYTLLTDNQVSLPGYVQSYVNQQGTIPGEGYWKTFKKGGYDYYGAYGYITFSPEKHLNFQFGNTQNFIGSGYRSLLLSDFAQNYLNLMVTARIWRFQYQNIFAQLTGNNFTTSPYPIKYAAFHYLTFDAAKFLNIGLFEGVIFNNGNNPGRGYDFSYLNPIIFYDAVVNNTGAVDKETAGANINILPCKNFKIYGQFLLNEFEAHQILSSDNWWGNKYGIQGGFKWIDIFGLHNVDWQSEFNLVRPYTYTSANAVDNYSQYGQPLADPMGANFREFINIVRINPIGPLDIKLELFYIQQGADSVGGVTDYGSNIFIPYGQRTGDYGIKLLQGELTNTIIAEAVVSYQLRHNLFIDLTGLARHETAPQYVQNTIYASIGLRLNFARKEYMF